MATRRIAQALHLKKTNLIQAAGKDIDSVAIVGCPLGEVVIELCSVNTPVCKEGRKKNTYLEGLLVVLDIVAINVVVRANRFP